MTCLWCGETFQARRNGGKPQRFCSGPHRLAFHAAARKGAERMVVQGRLSVADLIAPEATCTFATRARPGFRVVWATPDDLPASEALLAEAA
jgi:hypothetical protein